jgi:beta-N-acetylhexosaminidase
MTLGPLMVDLEGPELQPEEAERLAHPLVGGVILFSRNYRDRDQLRALVAAIHAVRDPPLLVAVDQEGGRVQRFREGFTRLPPLRWLGHQYDLDPAVGRRLAFQCGWLMAAELREEGVDFSFAPVLDLDYGTSEVIGDRALHRDPETVVILARAYLQGMRRAGMVATGKHFPGHGYVVADSHLELPVDPRTHAELYDDLLPFERLTADGPAGDGLAAIMMAHVRYPAVDGNPASLSPWWIGTGLRNQLGFRGVVFSDDLSMKALSGVGDMPERVRLALEAGVDMALVCNDPAAVARTLEALAGHQAPASQARLVALRGAPRAGSTAPLREQPAWQDAVAAIEAARERPPLALD